ncbi:MAG: O-antigen ligase family protein [Microbacteriaceae bacterium]
MPEVLLGFLGSARFCSALTVASVGAVTCAFALRQTMGWAGLIGILCGLVLLTGGSLLGRRRMVDWHGLLPISLMVFVGWVGLTVFWSQYRWASLGGIAYLVAITILGVYVALVRDTIQIIRAFGDVLRFVLVLSMALEILSGLLIDSPISFLAIQGNLARLGPISGIMETRDSFGLISIIALITFGMELRTRSVGRELGIGSMLLAAISVLLTRSPVIELTLLVVLIATAVLYGLRRVPAHARPFWAFGFLGAGLVLAGVVWAFRLQIIQFFNAGGDLNYRLNLWQEIKALIPLHDLEGWGWVGYWRSDLQPFTAFSAGVNRVSPSALNAFYDVWFQLGLVGLVIFLGLLALTFTRSWLLAARKRSVIFTWPALVLVTLVATSTAESLMLVEVGWLSFVICSVKAAHVLSWRTAIAAAGP